MKIQRIQWAGILIEHHGVVMMIDPIFNGYDHDFFGKPLEPLYNLSCFEKPNIIAITHLHSDHYDPQSILGNFGDRVQLIVPKSCVEKVKRDGFKEVVGLDNGEIFTYMNFDIIAESSVDGLGDEQVSYVIKNNGLTLIHCGDTLWHGQWRNMAQKYGPIDVAFLPINAAMVMEPGTTPSNQPICMGPEQACAAATLLNSKRLVPIHYGTFCHPPVYNETDKPIERLIQNKGDFEIIILKNKQEFIL
jgi:L-ascorbate metabolism protein UlaG (beta-lactamase superfamily)